jgi:hypothetical protein
MEESTKIIFMVVGILGVLVFASVMILQDSNKATETACNSKLSYEQQYIDKNFNVCKDANLTGSNPVWPGVQSPQCFNRL